MKKIAIIMALLSCNAFGQNRALNCDSTCIAPVNATQMKAQTVYGSNNGTYMQSQTLGCPNGYTGTYSQSRYVTINNGTVSYGNWATTSNSCQAVVIPPATPTPCPPSYMGYYVLNESTGEPIWTCTPIQTN